MREQTLHKIYESVKDRATCSEEVFASALVDWDVIPLLQDGELIGGVLAKSNELHVGVAAPVTASKRRYIREILQKTIDKYGFAITTIQPQNSVGLRFCERLGFVKIGERDGNILLRCDRSNYR